MFTIGTASSFAELPVKTVRYYSDIDLVTPSERSQTGYRLYGEAEVKKLIFVRRCRTFGFSVHECRELLDLFQDQNRESRMVKQIALQRISEIEQKMTELQTLHDELQHLADSCHGDSRPDCPIITSFSA